MYDVSWKQIGRIAAAIVVSTIVIVGLFSLHIFAGLSEVTASCLAATWICGIVYLTIQNIKEKLN